MEKLLKNMYLIKCSIFLCIGVITYSNGLNKASVSLFALAFLYSVFHLDCMINDKNNNNEN